MTSPLLDRGDVITAEHGARAAEFKIKGEMADDDTARALTIVLSTSDPEQKDNNNDVTFGTDQLQKVNGTWPLHADAIAADASRHGLPLKSEGIKVQTTDTTVTRQADKTFGEVKK